MRYSFCDSAHGPLLIAIDRDGLRSVEFVWGERPVQLAPEWQRDDRAAEGVALSSLSFSKMNTI